MRLEKFREAKRDELYRLRFTPPTAYYEGIRPLFIAPSDRINVIAEYKRASPSAGVINDKLSPEDVARQYAAGGADMMSVLTEERYFDGRLDYLGRIAATVKQPLLRKDFIFDELQVRETATTPASAMLLIVSLTPEVEHLRSLIRLADSFGIQPVVEIFSAAELRIAREAGARVIQVNNRDLETLKVDTTVTARLIHEKQAGEIWIAASGIDSHERLSRLDGYDAALIGSALMKSAEPGAALRRIIRGTD